MYAARTQVQYEIKQKTMDTARFSRLLRLTPQFELLSTDSIAKTQAQALINTGFRRAFTANLESFMPQLLTMHCVGKLSGVAGLCLAKQQSLFLEQYLAAPIESEIETISGLRTSRDGIVEVGNLVAANNGASLAVFIVLASSLQQAGFTHMVFTATESLREKFNRLGFGTQFLANADINMLKQTNQTNWGTYYDKSPQVVVGELSVANELIGQRSLYHCIQTTFSKQIESVTQQLISRKQ
jgi:hypothetical protein